MVELKAYRLKKDTIGHKAGEVFVKVHYGEDKMMRTTYPYKIVNDIHLDSIKNNFVEWCSACQSSTIIFATEEDAEASIEKHEKEWLTYFGVEGR